jgi:hypothetical protein
MDFHYRTSLSLSLPEVYAEYALDRAYRHETAGLLRPADGNLKKGSLDTTLLSGPPSWDPAKGEVLTLSVIDPLSSRAVRVPVSDGDRTARKVVLPVSLKGSTLGKENVRVFVFPEKDGVLQSGTNIEVSDVSKPVEVVIGAETSTLTVLIVNGSVATEVATVTFGAELARVSTGNTEIHFCPPDKCSSSNFCSISGGGEEEDWGGPLAWTGNVFKLVYSGITLIEGELSVDRKTLLWVKMGGILTIKSHWINLPLDPARSVSGRLVFAVSGEEARKHIVVEESCGPDYPFIDPSLPLKLETLLGP